MEKLNNDNFKTAMTNRLEELFAAETKENLDRALVRINRDLQTYANIRKEIMEFNELYNYFEKADAA